MNAVDAVDVVVDVDGGGGVAAAGRPSSSRSRSQPFRRADVHGRWRQSGRWIVERRKRVITAIVITIAITITATGIVKQPNTTTAEVCRIV